MASAITVNCWVLDYYLGQQCNGEQTGSMTIDSGPGVCTGAEANQAESILSVADANSNTELIFYAGGDCTGQILGSTIVEGCTELLQAGFGSVMTVDGTP